MYTVEKQFLYSSQRESGRGSVGGGGGIKINNKNNSYLWLSLGTTVTQKDSGNITVVIK